MLDAKFALAERFSASRFFDDCRRYDAVEFNTLGGMISILLKQPPRPDDADNPVRTVLSAGCPPDRWEEFERRFGVRIVEWFGMVDSPGFLLNTEGRVGSMGKPIGGIEFAGHRRRRANRSGPGAVGELVFRHPQGQLTYYHKLPEATETAYRGGWFHSGDLAERDDDGFYYYRGRKKESMRRLGENISAWEIETVVNGHPEGAGERRPRRAVGSRRGRGEGGDRAPARGRADAGGAARLLRRADGPLRHSRATSSSSRPCRRRRRNASSTPTLRQRGVTPDTWDRVAAGYKVQKR